MDVVRCELIMPLQLSGVRIQRQDAFGEEVVTRTIAIVGIWIGSRGRPVQRIGFRIEAAGQACVAAAGSAIFPLPGFVAWFSLTRHCPEPPCAFAGRSLISS